MDKNACAAGLVRLFPEKAGALEEHLRDYGELLGHLFFSEEIVLPLEKLLKEGGEAGEIGKYCDFIEKMWREGTPEVLNVVDVTILEELSDDSLVWTRLGKYLGDDLKTYINHELLKHNIMMSAVPPLERSDRG